MRQYETQLYRNHESELRWSRSFGEGDKDGTKNNGSKHRTEEPVPFLTVLGIKTRETRKMA
jgi:hypothetical protein